MEKRGEKKRRWWKYSDSKEKEKNSNMKKMKRKDNRCGIKGIDGEWSNRKRYDRKGRNKKVDKNNDLEVM